MKKSKIHLLMIAVILCGVAATWILAQDDIPSRIVAFTAEGPEMTSQISPRFGRTRYFTLVDVQSETLKKVVSLDPDQSGYDLANELIKFKPAVAITGKIGSNALHVLRAAELKVIQGVSGSVEDALRQFKSGELR